MAGPADDTPEDRNLRVMARWRSTGRVLVEALPFILKYDQKTIVVKYGGNAMSDTGAHDFSQDIVLMKQTGIDPVVVVEMVLTGSINKQIVTGIQAAGGRAVGLSGKDGNLVVARKVAMTRTNPQTGQK